MRPPGAAVETPRNRAEGAGSRLRLRPRPPPGARGGHRRAGGEAPRSGRVRLDRLEGGRRARDAAPSGHDPPEGRGRIRELARNSGSTEIGIGGYRTLAEHDLVHAPRRDVQRDRQGRLARSRPAAGTPQAGSRPERDWAEDRDQWLVDDLDMARPPSRQTKQIRHRSLTRIQRRPDRSPFNASNLFPGGTRRSLSARAGLRRRSFWSAVACISNGSLRPLRPDQISAVSPSAKLWIMREYNA